MTAFSQLLTDLDAAANSVAGPINPVVISNVTSPPSAFTIVSLRCGNVPDNQRRRNADQVEAYQTVAVVNG